MHIATAFSAFSFFVISTYAASPLQLDFTKLGKRPAAPSRTLTRRASLDAQLYNDQGIQYNVNVTIGTPPQHLTVQLDTGSANFWIPSVNATICQDGDCILGAFDANKSTTYTYVNDTFYMAYYDPSDYDAGDYITDNVGIGGLLVKNMSMGLAYDAVDYCGVLGISFTFEEEGMYEPTLIDLMKSNGIIDRKAYSLFLNDIESGSGSIIFGGIDTTKYEGDLIALPMQPSWSDNVTDFSVALTSVSMIDATGTHQVSFDNFTATPAILDSGTWDMMLPSDIANAIIEGMGAVYTDLVGYVVPCQYGDGNATFVFNFGGPGGPNISVPLREMLTDAGFPFKDGKKACSLGVEAVDLDLGGLVLLGDSFLRSAYVVYDLENLEIAMANVRYNVSSSHIVNIPSGTGLPGVTSTATASVANPTAIDGGFTSTLVAGTPTYSLGTAAGAPTASATHQQGTSGARGRDVEMGHLCMIMAIAGMVLALA